MRLHPSGRVFVSRHVQFNPDEFPYLTLFSPVFFFFITVNAKQFFYIVFAIPSFTFFHFLCSQVAQPYIPPVSTPISTNSSNLSLDQVSTAPDDKHLQSTTPRASAHIPKHKAVPAPSIHPMLTRSTTKHLLTTSPHALVSSLEPSTVHEALLDS